MSVSKADAFKLMRYVWQETGEGWNGEWCGCKDDREGHEHHLKALFDEAWAFLKAGKL